MSRSIFRSISSDNPYAGASHKDVQVAQVAIEAIRKVIVADEIGPTKVIADGKQEWINRFLREMRGYRLVDRGHAEILWVYFTQVHGARFPGLTPKEVLDDWFVSTPPTHTEIYTAWRIDSASSHEAREQFYGSGGPDAMLQQLVDQNPVTLPAAPDSPTPPNLTEV